jgi:hypothetical protein
MTDHYAVLGVDRVSSQEDVAAAFERLLAARKTHRQKTSDLHVAYAILADAGLRRAYDLACFGAAASDRIVEAGPPSSATPKTLWPKPTCRISRVRRVRWRSRHWCSPVVRPRELRN